MPKINWDLKHIGERIVWNKIKTLRLEKKLTQVQVSAYSGVAIATIWMIENGYDKTTSKRTKQRLASFFQCDVSDLFPVVMIGNQIREEYLKGKQSQKD